MKNSSFPYNGLMNKQKRIEKVKVDVQCRGEHVKISREGHVGDGVFAVWRGGRTACWRG